MATAVTWAGPGEHFTKRATEVTAQDLPELADQGEKVRGHITSTVRATAQEGSLRQRTQETTCHHLFQDGCAKASPPDYGLASQDGQGQTKNGPEGPSGDG